LPGGFGEVIEIYRLADVAVDAELVAADDVAFFIGGGENDDWQHARGLTFADAPEDLQALDLGKLEIKEDDLGTEGILAEEQVDRFFAVAGNAHVIGNVGLFESPNGEQFVVGVVFNEKDQFGVAHFQFLILT
jgi:hypothetical protein